MSKWDEIYGPATPLADLESRIMAIEFNIDKIMEAMHLLVDANRQTNEAVRYVVDGEKWKS